MAGFVEVMTQFKRMCESFGYGCKGCRLSATNNRRDLPCETFIEDYPAEAETFIVEWAAAHPEPRYPSWADGWKQLFPEATLTDIPYSAAPCPRHFIQRSLDKCDSCKDCLNEPMPAEVARKLGIKPLEGGNDRG